MYDLTDPKNLIDLLNTFFAYQEENIVDWYAAVEEFRGEGAGPGTWCRKTR